MALGGSELIRRCKFYEYSRELKSHDPEDSRGLFTFTSDIQRLLYSGSIRLSKARIQHMPFRSSSGLGTIIVEIVVE